MSRGAGWRRRRPPWWPENEPWPPRRRWPARRRRFFRLFAVTAALIFLLSVYGAVSLISILASRAGLSATFARGEASLLLIGAGTIASLAVVVFVAFARRVALPIGSVMEAADRVAGGDYAARVAESGPLAVRGLARAFNTMTERLQRHDHIRRDLMADIAHELRTPLTVMQGKLEGMIDGVYPRDEPHLGEVLEQTVLLSRLVEDLRTLALTESGGLKLQKEPTDVVDLARGVVRAFEREAMERGVTIHIEAPGDVPLVPIDSVRIREVLGNLVSNALRHTSSGASIGVRIASAEDAVRIEVRDTGTGMSADELARAFDRFYKGPASSGSGLGLTIARNLVRAHGGEITATSQPEQGTTMRFTLPRA